MTRNAFCFAFLLYKILKEKHTDNTPLPFIPTREERHGQLSDE